MNARTEHKSRGLRVHRPLRTKAIEMLEAVGRTVFAARIYAGRTNPATTVRTSFQRHRKVKALNQKPMFEVKSVRSGALRSGVEVKLITAFPASQFNEPFQHLTAQPAAPHRPRPDRLPGSPSQSLQQEIRTMPDDIRTACAIASRPTFSRMAMYSISGVISPRRA